LKIELLSGEHLSALNEGLSLASKLVEGEIPFSIEQVQSLYDTLLKRRSEPAFEIALGLAFGSVVISRSGFEWARISDEYGEETCIAVQNTHLICSPISMIQKRLERGERTDLSELCDGTIEVMRENVDSADYKPR